MPSKKKNLSPEKQCLVFGADRTPQSRVLSLRDLNGRERPESLEEAFTRAREWHKINSFVSLICKLKKSFFNHGFKLKAVDPKGKLKLAKMLEDEEVSDRVNKYVGDVWSEWLIQDNTVSFWRTDQPPYILKAEDCEYKNAMWQEILKVRLGLTANDLKDADLTEKQKQRYSKGVITLDEDEGEFFRVVTRQMSGHGFCFPLMYGAFRTLSQNDSMEVGESMLAYAGRDVIRQHKIGFELKSAANAMKQADFLYKEKRALSIQQFLEGRKGFMDMVTQFDHAISHVWVDPKLYDGRKWDTIFNRLMMWAGPTGFMLLAKSVSPFLLKMLGEEAVEERGLVGRHLATVINHSQMLGKGAPKVQVVFSSRIFNDSRLAWDMVKVLMQQGPLSLTTALKEADFDPAEESELKRDEAPASRNAELLPKFDAAHGNRPGRKEGSKDPGNVQA